MRDSGEDAAIAVRVRGLVKRFGDVTALCGLDLTVPRGVTYAFLGPNGAGKSTTISVLTGLFRHDAGAVEILGLDPALDPLNLKARIGVVPEELSLFERLTGRQHLTFCGRMYGLPGAEAARRADELLELTDLAGRSSALVAEYSKGMRRRLAIAAALIHAPDLVFLDEPFEGIDVMAAGVIRALIAELAARGVTVLLTTHVLEIAERLASHAGVVAAGRMLDEGPLDALYARHGRSDLTGVFEALAGAPPATGAALSFFGTADPDASSPAPAPRHRR